MIPSPEIWLASISDDRAAELLKWRSFDEIVAQFSTCEIAPMWWEPADKIELKEKGAHRAAFVLTVRRELYDAFFNAPVGYRAQYAKSAAHGEAANRRLLDALTPRLLEVATLNHQATREAVMTSLRGAQAKVWIDGSEETDDSGLINHPEWERNDTTGEGLRAPRGTKLDLKGGWISAAGKEVSNRAKCNRSYNLSRTGYPG